MSDRPGEKGDAPPRPRRRVRWRRRLRRVLGWAAGLYVLAAFAVTHVPRVPAAAGAVPHLDKFVHATIFVGLALLTAGWRVTRGDAINKARWVALPLCLVYAAADEATQSFLPNRTASFWDFAADAAGTLLGLAAAGPALRWFRKHG